MQVLNRVYSFVKDQASAKVAAAVAIGTAMASSANAAGIDVASLVTEIADQKTSIGLIGLAVLGVVVAVAAFTWVRRAIK